MSSHPVPALAPCYSGRSPAALRAGHDAEVFVGHLHIVPPVTSPPALKPPQVAIGLERNDVDSAAAGTVLRRARS